MNEDLEDMVKERTKDLLVSREYFKYLADNIPVLIWTADMKENLIILIADGMNTLVLILKIQKQNKRN